jgi:hypothetical protein
MYFEGFLTGAKSQPESDRGIIPLDFPNVNAKLDKQV